MLASKESTPRSQNMGEDLLPYQWKSPMNMKSIKLATSLKINSLFLRLQPIVGIISRFAYSRSSRSLKAVLFKDKNKLLSFK
jgi:hypothetical protein